MNISIVVSIFSASLSVIALFLTYNVSVTTQRAFVFIKEIQPFLLNDVLVVMPKWQNSGATPTRKMLNHVNWSSFPDGIPNGYLFPDLKADGALDDKRGNIATFLGPKAEIFGEQLKIPTSTLEAASQGKTKLFIWGWTTYDDVFWFTSGHNTEFCNQIQVTSLGIDTQTKAVNAGISFSQCPQHNCIDGDCK